jgi:serine/threonine protein kinase
MHMLNPTSIQTDCLEKSVMKDYLAGHLSAEESAPIEDHLSACEFCEKRMQEVEADQADDELLQPIVSMGQASDSGWKRPWFSWQDSKEIGPYELIQPIGNGGMGLVYLARHRKLDRYVAMKLLPAHHPTPDARLRFQREILATGRLHHSSIVAATDAGHFRDMDYLVMEYVRGMDLGHLGRLLPCLSISETCEIGRQIASGLSYAHGLGFVHRDIKPSNVILDESGTIKILDFGLVLFDRWDGVSSELTTVGQFLGTLDYMAPEQAERSGSVDYRADLYALGATLFKLLCGRAPLAASPNLSPIDKIRLLATHRPPSLKTLRPDAPAKLVELVDSLLATAPQDRPPSAAHVSESLEPLADRSTLIDLIKRAREKENSSDQIPTRRLKEHSEHRMPTLPRNETMPSSRSGNGWRRWAAVAMLMMPLMFLAGYILRLDTPEGQFIIESEVADARLRIVKAGTETRSLKVQTGNSVTKLSAGKYEVTLESPSDGVSLDRDSFVIANGETVIARVRRETQKITPTANGSSKETTTEDTPKTTSSEPMYDRLTLSEWLDVATREKQPSRWADAILACVSLMDSENEKALFEKLFRLCVERQNLRPLVIARFLDDGRLANRVLQEINDSSPNQWPDLLRFASISMPRDHLDPIWTWLSALAENDKNQASMLIQGMLERSDGSNKVVSQQTNFDAVSYLAEHFPSLATLCESFIVNPQFAIDGSIDFKKYLMTLVVRKLNDDRLAFEEHVNALQFYLYLRTFAQLEERQEVEVLMRVAKLLGQLWENRNASIASSLVNPHSFPELLFDPTALRVLPIDTNRSRSAPSILGQFLLARGLTKEAAIIYPILMPPLRILEEQLRPIAQKGWEELPMKLNKPLSEHVLGDRGEKFPFSFKGRDLRLADNALAQVQSLVSEEERKQMDDWSVALALHQIVFSTLSGRPTISPGSPDQLAEILTQFNHLDSNKDNLILETEMREMTPAEASLFSGKFPFELRAFVSTILDSKKRTKPPSERFLEWARSKIKKVDKDGNGTLSPDEFKEGNFELVDDNRNGQIELEEYVRFRNKLP